MRLVVWQRSANGAIPENTGAEWYSAHKARIRKGYFQKAIRVHTGRDSGAEPAAARPSRDKNAAEAGQVTVSDELFAAHSRPLPGLRQEKR